VRVRVRVKVRVRVRLRTLTTLSLPLWLSFSHLSRFGRALRPELVLACALRSP
jgi:hypothetical protein